MLLMQLQARCLPSQASGSIASQQGVMTARGSGCQSQDMRMQERLVQERLVAGAAANLGSKDFSLGSCSASNQCRGTKASGMAAGAAAVLLPTTGIGVYLCERLCKETRQVSGTASYLRLCGDHGSSAGGSHVWVTIRRSRGSSR